MRSRSSRWSLQSNARNWNAGNAIIAPAALRQQGAAKIIVAVPVGAPITCREIRNEVDDILCLHTPGSFMGVGQYYEDFSQTSDEEVRELLAAPASRGPEADV